MDDSSRRRRQNDPPISNTRYQALDPSQQQQRRPYAGNPREAFRPAPLTTTASSSGSQRMGGSSNYSGYYADQSGNFPAAGMSQGALAYQQSADYGQADARQTQGFAASSYNPTMMYNVPSSAGAHGAGVYDTSQAFSSRQPGSLGMMATDVTNPYFGNDPANPTAAAAAAASALQSQSSTGASQAVYQPSGLPSYGAGGMSAAALGGMANQGSGAPDVGVDDEYGGASAGLNQAYTAYQNHLKEIFSNIRNGALATASDSLINVSNWLLGHVVELGLTQDDHNLHSDRIKLWNDFNHAWLAMLQRQKEMMQSGQQLQRSQTLITQEGLDKMGKELVRLCDSIEPHGLVDYQYGVWEERIIEILHECADLHESSDDSNDNAGGSSSHHR